MSGFLAALRIARRDARRAWGRSLLVIAMIALPVLGVGLVATLVATSTGSPQTRADMSLGHAEALLDVSPGTPVAQAPDPRRGYVNAGDVTARRDGTAPPEVTPHPPATAAAASALAQRLVRPGSRLISRQQGSVQLRRADGQLTTTPFVELAYDDPAVAGLVTQLRGRAPRTSTELAVTESLARTAGLTVGSTTRVEGVTRPLTVVGVVRVASDWGQRSAFGLPGSVLAAARPAASAWSPDSLPLPTFYVDAPSPLSWPDVTAMNDAGVLVTSRAVLLDPPARAEVPYDEVASSDGGGGVFGPTVIVVGLALLEVVLLAGPAFAVGARRSRRELALVAATGATSRQVARLVLARALVLGLVAAVLGTVAAVSLAALAHPLAERLAHHDYGPTRLPHGQLAALAAVAVATALLAAAVPAWQAARMDVVAALSGRRAVVATRRRAPVLGIVVTLAGTALAALGAWRHQATWIMAGSMVAEIGFVVMMPALVGAAGRLAPLLPLSPRLALRDASRNRMRSAPAVAAVMAAAAGSVAVGTYLASSDLHDRQGYAPRALAGQAVIYGDPATLERAAHAAATVLPVAHSHDVRALAYECGEDRSCVAMQWDAPDLCVDGLTVQARTPCEPIPDGQFRRGAIVVAPEDLPRLLGTSSAAAADALRRGGVLVSNARLLDPGSRRSDGTGTSTWTLTPTSSADSASTPGPSRSVTLPAAVLPADAAQLALFVVPPEVVSEYHAVTRLDQIVLDLQGKPDDVAVQRARDAVAALGDIGTDVTVEQGYGSEYGATLLALAAGAALVTLGAAGIATALSITDARPDLVTLAAVGATPRVRRRLAAAQSAVVALLGAALGVVAGLVPGAAVVWSLGHRQGSFTVADPHWHVVVPWPVILVLAVAVPLVAAVASGGFVRARIPLERTA